MFLLIVFCFYSSCTFTGSTLVENPLLNEPSAYPKTINKESHSVYRYSTFVKFCISGLGRLGLHDSQHIEYSRVWKEAEDFSVSLSFLGSLSIFFVTIIFLCLIIYFWILIFLLISCSEMFLLCVVALLICFTLSLVLDLS